MLGADGSALDNAPWISQAACETKTGSTMQKTPIGIQEWALSKPLKTILTFWSCYDQKEGTRTRNQEGGAWGGGGKALPAAIFKWTALMGEWL